MEVSEVRRQLRHAIDRAKARAQQKRHSAAEAERAYATFLDEIATPTARTLASALKAEGYPFTVSTPSGGLRLASDRGRDDYIELALDPAANYHLSSAEFGARAAHGHSRTSGRSSQVPVRRISTKPTSSLSSWRRSSPGWSDSPTRPCWPDEWPSTRRAAAPPVRR